jgi:hypothetical protein
MALSLGAEGISYLQSRQWEAGLSYRYLHADRIFSGSREQPQLRDAAIIDVHSFDLITSYAFTKRFSATLTLPFLYGRHNTAWEHDNTNRHTTTAGGIGDLRLLGNAWLLDPAKHVDGNISLSAGFKAPTGEYDAKDTFYQPGPVKHPVDAAIQPGDGGWGIVLEGQAYQKVFKNAFVYAAGQYLMNPRGHNGTLGPVAYVPGIITTNSVTDQFMGRAGLFYTIWPEQGLAVSLGGRIEGIPVHDLIGNNEGIRTSGYSISIEPGLYYSRGKNNFSLTTPVALYRNRTQSDVERDTGTTAFGGFYDIMIIASFSRRF